MPAFCNMCGRQVGHSGVRVTLGFYVGFYMCADIAVTAKQMDDVRRVLESCCLPANMPVILEVFVTHPDLNLVLGRFLKFGTYEKVCAFRRFLLPRLQMPTQLSHTTLTAFKLCNIATKANTDIYIADTAKTKGH